MALINLRNALMTGKRLPYDAEVEYLESTGAQWINTGVVSSGIDIKCLMAFTDNTVANQGVFGSRVNSGDTGSNAYQIWYNVSANSLRLDWARYTKSATVSLNTPVSIEAYQNGSVYVNGTQYTGSAKTANAYNFYIFNFNQGGATGATGCRAKVYSFQIWQNGTLVRDFIPVRKGTTGELYDRVSGKFAERHGDFVLGPDVVPVEWLKSNGTPYIDTGVVVQSSDVIKFRSKSSAGGSTQVDAIQSIVGQWDASPNYFLMTKISGASAFQVWAYATYKDIIMGYSGGNKYIGKVNSWEINLAEGFAKIETYDNTYSIGISPGGPSPDQPTLMLMPPNASRAISVYDFSITRNGVKILNFTPVRIGTDATSWEGAMMDVLTRRIYRNQGTGAFSYGNDLKYPIPAD